MTLLDVERQSGGRFKPSTIAGYERGERLIALDRLLTLADLYAVPADTLVRQVLARLQPVASGGRRLVIDLTRLELIEREDERRAVVDLVRTVRARRGGDLGDAISLRSGDLEAIAAASRVSTEDLLVDLRPALRAAEAPATGSPMSRRPT